MSLAGVDPAKLIEIVPATGALLQIIPVTGISKTNASALAMYKGDAYLFTEAQPAGCDVCLASTCEPGYSNCLADSVCADHLACAIERTIITDDCGGLIPSPLQTCLLGDCDSSCLVPLSARVSQVTRLDVDNSGGLGLDPMVVNDAAPIRIVGAGNSPCVPYVP